jgi:hypothetical protein
MTQREFERRVKGLGKQPHRWSRRERSQPGRSRALPRATFAILCVGVLLGLTATATHDFSFDSKVSAQTAQLTGNVAVAKAAEAPAVVASAAPDVPHDGQLQRVAAHAHHSARHSGAALPRHTSAALAGAPGHEARTSGGVDSAAADAAADGVAAKLGAAVIWAQTSIRSWFTPVVGVSAADTVAESFREDFPLVLAAGAFIVVMLLCLGAGLVMSTKGHREQRAEA